jgi:Acetyltransferase (GNAT) domain
MARLMRFEATATFTHPDWLRAISAQVPGAEIFQFPHTGLPRLTAALKAVRLPFKHYESWVTPLTPMGVPSVAPGAALAISGLINGLDAPILFRSLPLSHPVTEALLAQSPSSRIMAQWERAGLDVSGSFETWLAENFDSKRRKELKRLKARLGEQGSLELAVLQPAENLTPFIENLLALEASGWKGKRGTAVAQDAAMARALRGGLAAMHERGRVRFWQMTLDGKPVASLFALIDGSEASLGKIAFDEAFAKYSPGVLLILEATQALFAEEHVLLADSNAIPDHPMINRIWRDRIVCVDVLAAGNTVPAAQFKFLASWLGLRKSLRTTAKNLLVRVTKRKVS